LLTKDIGARRHAVTPILLSATSRLQSKQADTNPLPDLTQHLSKAQLNTVHAIRALPHAVDTTQNDAPLSFTPIFSRALPSGLGEARNISSSLELTPE